MAVTFAVRQITDLNGATKDLVKSTELETLVTVIVNKLLNNFERIGSKI